jgi:hypothetical protein
MRRRPSLVIGIAILGMGLAPPAAPLVLPPDLAGYRQWTALLKQPLGVSERLWAQCMAPTPAQWASQTAKHGPHTQHYIRVYANPPAAARLASGERGALPVGAIVAKEKLGLSPDGAPAGVAFMIKRAGRAFAESGGWEFAYFPDSGDSRRTHRACAACHQAASSDYVFGPYPR